MFNSSTFIYVLIICFVCLFVCLLVAGGEYSVCAGGSWSLCVPPACHADAAGPFLQKSLLLVSCYYFPGRRGWSSLVGDHTQQCRKFHGRISSENTYII